MLFFPAEHRVYGIGCEQKRNRVLRRVFNERKLRFSVLGQADSRFVFREKPAYKASEILPALFQNGQIQLDIASPRKAGGLFALNRTIDSPPSRTFHHRMYKTRR